MMSNNKLTPAIFNSPADNISKLAALFPSAVKDGELDITALREELGQFEEVGAEKYELTWAGKQAAKKLSQSDVPGRTLKYVPQDSKNSDTTENLYIEGDNLEVLKLLRQNYYGAVKMIYIDPPYNTGGDKFIYPDDYSMSEAESDEAEGDIVDGERMRVNQKSSNKFHARWLNMIYPRLRIAKNLLRDDGVIILSIDDNEVHNLRKLCDEIFGVENFIATIANINNPKGRSDDKFVATAHEYLLIYAKNSLSLDWYGFEPTDEIIRRYNKIDDKGQKYREIDLRKTGESDLREDRPNLFYYFHYCENTNDFYPSRTKEAPDGYIAIFPQREDEKEGNWRWGMDTAQKQISDLIPKFMPSRKVWGVMQKDYLENRDLVKPTSAWTFKDVNSERGSEQFIDLGFDKRIFPKPKPTGTIERIIKLTTTLDDIILDFFSGSATTAHAVMQFNVEDGKRRKFIMLQYPEICDIDSEAVKAGYPNICEIGKDRIRRAGDKIKAEIETANTQVALGEEPKQVPDIGFRVFRVADTNIRWTHMALTAEQLELDENMLSEKDRLDFMPGYTDVDVVYEILLRQRDIPLSSKVEKLDIGSRTYIFADAYVVCLDDAITVDLVEALAAVEPTPIKYVFRDSAFEDNISLKDETVRRLEAYIARNSGEQKKAYTVEFI